MLMHTPLIAECGQVLKTKLTMHEEMLRCHSKKLDQLFTNEMLTRKLSKVCKSICDKVATYLFPELNPKQFEEAGSEEQVRIFRCPRMVFC
jgi:hypothetical protein